MFMSARAREWLKVYIPGKYPEHLLEDLRRDFRLANITDPQNFLRSVSLSVFIVGILLAILAFLFTYLTGVKGGSIVPTSTIPNPIPLKWRPVVYPLLTYLLVPIALFPVAVNVILKGKISSRKDNIDAHLHQFLIALLGFAKAKCPLKEIAKEIMNLDLGEISKEFAKIYYSVQYGNKTLKVAMLEAAEYSPSNKFADLLRGIVNVIEAGGDLARFVENRLQVVEVEKKTERESYLKKLEMIAEVYMTLTIALPTVFITLSLAKIVSGEVDFSMLVTMIYFLLPLLGAGLVFVLYALSPEKGLGTTRGMNYLSLAPILAGVAAVMAILLGRNMEFWSLLGVSVGLIIGAILSNKYMKEEQRISEQLPFFLSRVLSLIEAGKDVTSAFKESAKDVPSPFGKYLRVFSEMLDKGMPRNKAFKWLEKRTPNRDVKITSGILMRAIDIGSNITSILISLTSELARLNAHRIEKRGTQRTYAALMAIGALMFCGLAVQISTGLLDQFEKFAQNLQSTSQGIGGTSFGIVSPIILNQAREMIRHSLYVVSIVAGLGIGGLSGDFRKIALPVGSLLLVALTLSVLFLRLWP